MSPLEERVASYVNGWRFVFSVICSFSFGWILLSWDFFSLVIAIPLAFLIYHSGFWAILHWLIFTSPPEMIMEEIQNQKITEINERLNSGDLEPGAELDQLLKEAGLKALTTVCEYGPVLGKLEGFDFFEWIAAKEGQDGEIKKFNFVGKCETDGGGNFKTPSSTNFYIVYDNILYEHIPQT